MCRELYVSDLVLEGFSLTTSITGLSSRWVGLSSRWVGLLWGRWGRRVRGVQRAACW